MLANLCPSVPHLYTSWTPLQMVARPPPWAACSNASPLFLRRKFPNIQPEPPWHILRTFPLVLSPLPRRRDWLHLTTTSFQAAVEKYKVSPELPFLQIEQSSSLSCSLSDLCYRCFTASLPFSGHAPGPQCLSCSEWPKTEHSTWGAASPGLNIDGQLIPCSYWQNYFWYKPGCPIKPVLYVVQQLWYFFPTYNWTSIKLVLCPISSRPNNSVISSIQFCWEYLQTESLDAI